MNPGLHYDLPNLGLSENYHPRRFAALWQHPLPQWRHRLAEAIEKGLGNQAPRIFFRADDIGAGGRPFEALCRLFRSFEIPLAMAVVPAWITAIRVKQLFQLAPREDPLWGWHQHGWCHVNWQRSGKSSEFGEERPLEKQFSDISQGRRKLQDIFGEHLVDVFTPPWNRLSLTTMKILEELDFKAVSMTAGFPRGYKNPDGIKNLRIQLDLHTRKSKDGISDFGVLLDELSTFLGRREPIGIMIHHQRMTYFAFEFLRELLTQLQTQAEARFSTFRELIAGNDEE